MVFESIFGPFSDLHMLRVGRLLCVLRIAPRKIALMMHFDWFSDIGLPHPDGPGVKNPSFRKDLVYPGQNLSSTDRKA